MSPGRVVDHPPGLRSQGPEFKSPSGRSLWSRPDVPPARFARGDSVRTFLRDAPRRAKRGVRVSRNSDRGFEQRANLRFASEFKSPSGRSLRHRRRSRRLQARAELSLRPRPDVPPLALLAGDSVRTLHFTGAARRAERVAAVEGASLPTRPPSERSCVYHSPVRTARRMWHTEGPGRE